MRVIEFGEPDILVLLATDEETVVVDDYVYDGTIKVHIVAFSDEAEEVVRADTEGILSVLGDEMADAIDNNPLIISDDVRVVVTLSREERGDQ